MGSGVLVTGGAGFIGHHLVERFLKDTELEIFVLDRLDLSGDLSRLAYLKDKYPDKAHRIKVIWHDLKAPIDGLNRKRLEGVNYIYHLAAGSHVDRSIDHPMEFVMDNVVGTANLLDFARSLPKENLKLFAYFSTDEVFGPAPEGVDYKEWDRYNSGNPYSASKAGAEELCLAYHNTYKLPIIITHCMNVFGERQHPEKYIPLCINRILKGERIYIHANKECDRAGSRYYIHAKEVCDAVFHLLHMFDSGDLTFGDKFNIVGSEEIDNLELARRIASFMEMELNYELVDFHSSRPGHDLRYALDGSKMKGFGWEPNPLDECIKSTIEWYLQEENSEWLGG